MKPVVLFLSYTRSFTLRWY